jgi:DNA helicase HerA-like ATPase
LGHLIASGRHLKQSKVALPFGEIARHCFVAGTTGSGKTTTVIQILSQLAEQGVPFLVLEPAKTEYRAFFDHLRGQGKNPLRLTLRDGTGPGESRLHFNPWRVPPGTPLGRYIEGIKILLRSCFAMQESLPQILERAIFEVYSELGWTDLSEIVGEQDGRRFPTFDDFVEKKSDGTKSFIARVVEKLGYSSEPQRNLTAAMTVRLESFTRGMKKALFSGEEDPFGEIFSRPVFVELADLNEPDIKRFLLGAIVMRLAAQLQSSKPNAPASLLKHLTVLEEAHHFLREAIGHGPGAELARESNLLLADAFAEMRGYGEGILVADQAPAELSPAVLRNTNIKIAHRLMYQQDCDAMGDAMGLDDSQKRQLRSLDTGECIIQSASIARPVQCQIENPQQP